MPAVMRPVPGSTRRLVFAVLLATLALAVAASPAGAAGHATHTFSTTTGKNVGIVDIYTKLGYEDGAAAGTGMLISRSGEVLTNNHVIRGATKFKVVDVTTHRSYDATVVGYSVSRDIAVLQLANASNLRTVKLGGYLPLHVGQQVVARGNAQGLGGAPKEARGQVIALHRKIVARDISGESETLHNVIATNTRVQPGDSGGPLQNANNRVIGMVTAGSTVGAPRGFAIPIRQALRDASAIKNGKASAAIHVGPTAFIGVVLKNVSGGTQIQQVLPNLPAETAGLVAGDVITSLNGITIATMDDMRKALLSLPVGTAVPIGYTDTSGVAQTGSITPASGPPQ
ncbi:MAG TPA: trypsin-like peptidase domain-containing protein, partial [Gaiellaceae bacterium]|nr:trypsin-like peptidase domain-containing protein [Gaiellaceae bacterium]